MNAPIWRIRISLRCRIYRRGTDGTGLMVEASLRLWSVHGTAAARRAMDPRRTMAHPDSDVREVCSQGSIKMA